MNIRVKEYRKKANLTQAQLAKKIGTVQNAVSQWEKGGRTPSVKMCKKMAGVFGISVDELIGEE